MLVGVHRVVAVAVRCAADAWFAGTGAPLRMNRSFVDQVPPPASLPAVDLHQEVH